MIKVNVVKLNTNVMNLTKYKNSFASNYNNYYKNTEYSSDYWVGKYATMFYDFQLGNKSVNQKTVNNVSQFLDLVSFTYDKYSKIVEKNITIELDKKITIDDQYKRIISYVDKAIGFLEDVENKDTGGAISKLSNANRLLGESKERTSKLFQKVSDSEDAIGKKIANMEIKKVVPLEIDSYMVR